MKGSKQKRKEMMKQEKRNKVREQNEQNKDDGKSKEN